MATSPLKPIRPWINEDAQFQDIGYESTWAKPGLILTLNEEQLAKLQPMIDTAVMDLYADRYIALHPYSRWHRLFDTRMRMLVNRWGPQLAQLLDMKGLKLTDGGSVGQKEKTVESDYPNTSINPGKEAYASHADDHVDNRKTRLGAMQAISDFNNPSNPYQDPITAIADGMGTMFSMLVY